MVATLEFLLSYRSFPLILKFAIVILLFVPIHIAFRFRPVYLSGFWSPLFLIVTVSIQLVYNKFEYITRMCNQYQLYFSNFL